MSKINEAAANYSFSILGDRETVFGDRERMETHFINGAAWQKENGGINWISVDKELPPPNEYSAYGDSDKVLCCDKLTGKTWKDMYSYKPFTKEPRWIFAEIQPTHWAKINLPE